MIDFQQLVKDDDMVIIYTNRGNVLNTINSTIKDLIKKYLLIYQLLQ